MLTSGRIGSLLILGGCVLWIAAGAVRGDISPDGRGLRPFGELLSSVSLVLVGAGAAVLSAIGPRPFQDGWTRLGLGVVALGLAALAGSPLIPIPPGTNSLQSWPYIISTALGFAATVGGSLLTVAALVRASHRAGPSR